MFVAASLAILTATAPAAALAGTPHKAAHTLFMKGQFAAAADAAREAGTPESLALAARSTLVIAAYEVDTKKKALQLIDEALADADAALALKPGHVGATLQKAIGTGYRAQLTHSAGGAKRARRLMEYAARQEPDNPLAQVSLGGWHSGAIGRLGRFMGSTLLGAKRDKALAAFDRAVMLDDEDPIYTTFYAIGLVDMGMEEETAKLRELLTLAANGPPAMDGFERLVRARAREMLAAVGDEDALEEITAASRPFALID
ncbi:MAG: hypothetical protein AAF205_13730 [Pseudomonadota bacterium]